MKPPHLCLSPLLPPTPTFCHGENTSSLSRGDREDSPSANSAEWTWGQGQEPGHLAPFEDKEVSASEPGAPPSRDVQGAKSPSVVPLEEVSSSGRL